jgi:hypothetical protein
MDDTRVPFCVVIKSIVSMLSLDRGKPQVEKTNLSPGAMVNS